MNAHFIALNRYIHNCNTEFCEFILSFNENNLFVCDEKITSKI